MRRFLNGFLDACLRGLRSSQAFCLLLGGASGAFLLAWCFQWTAQFGTSLPAVTALALALLLGVETGWRPAGRVESKHPHRWLLGGLAFLTACSIALPGFLEWESRWLGLVPVIRLITPGISLALLLVFAGVAVTPLAFVLTRLPFLASAQRRSEKTLAWYFCGLACGVVISAFLLAPFWGLRTATLLFAGLSLITAVVRFVRSNQTAKTVETAPSTATEAIEQPHRLGIWSALLILCAGVMFAWVSRAIDQLLPSTVNFAASAWAGLILGWSFGIFWASRSWGTSSRAPHSQGLLPALFLGGWTVLVAAAFPLLVSVCLDLTVSVSSVFLLSLCRLGLVLMITAPLGFAWGLLSASSGGVGEKTDAETSRHVASSDIPLFASAFVAGWLVFRWALLPMASMPMLLVDIASAVFLVVLVKLLTERSLPAGWLRKSFAAGLSVLLLTSFLWSKNYHPAASARLLFQGPVFASLQRGLDRELLTAIDEGRHLTTIEGQNGTYTLWKYRGAQFQFRQDGLPKGMASENTLLCPEFSAETLPVAFPLVLHERPETMLIMGLGSGVSIKTALAFPVQEIRCVEGDPGLIKLVQNHVWPASGFDPKSDPRFSLLPIAPSLWVRSQTGRFDVIVSHPHQPALADSAAQFTESFYRNAAAKLSEDGLFCQRFAFIDFGPEALRVAAETMQSAFENVAFLEMAGGEMLLLGTNSPKGVPREGLLDRLQKRHVRRQLAQLGWDWSVPLNLTAFNNESLEKFVSEKRNWKTGPNTSANGTLAFRLPGEMMRWGNKPYENQQALAAHAGRFAQWGDIDPQDPDLLRRLAEVTGQRKMMTTQPDEYWAYRKAVKEQVTKRPRSVIVQVKGELPRKEIHPDEKNRLAYFRSLADTLKHAPHRLEDIAEVESFAEPYDPLLSYFLHNEVAELHSRAEPRDYQKELWHRMHSVFFAAPGDRSVRSLSAAIEILTEHPESVSDVARRWDSLNALLQMVKQRWSVRAGMTPKSTEVTLNDVDESLSAVQSALKTMDSLYAEVGVSEQEWLARKRFVETTVIHPLRAYRRQLQPFHDRERAYKAKKANKEEG